MRISVPVALVVSSLAGVSTLGVSQTIVEHVQALTRAGVRSIEAGERDVDVQLPGRSSKGAVAVFYDASSGLFCWVFGLGDPGGRPGVLDGLKSGSQVYLAEDRMVLFTMVWRSLAIRASSERAESLQDALEMAAAGAERRKDELPRAVLRGFDLYQLVDLGVVGLEFFAFRDRSEVAPSPQIVAVALTNGEWEVTVRGPNADRVAVTLDSSFHLQAIRRLQ